MENRAAPDTTANIAAMILQHAEKAGDSTAILTSRALITYRGLEALTSIAAASLVAAGVQKGDTVGLSFRQAPDHIIAMLAVARIGAVSVPLHRAWAPAMRRAIASRYAVSFILAHDVGYKLEGIGFMLLNEETFQAATGRTQPTVRLEGNAPFRVAMSSGTTGDPKGVLFSHDYMRRRMAQTCCNFDTSSRLIPADLNFSVGFVFALSLLAAGGTIVFPGSRKILDIVRAVNVHAVTHLFLSPAEAQPAVQQFTGSGPYFATLKQLRIIGSTPSPSLIDELRNRFTPNLVVPYGMTEFGIISQADSEMLRENPDSVGRVLPWVRIEIVDEAGYPVKTGEVGTVRAATEGMPAGYYRDEARSVELYRDGWYYPGDLGRLDADGLLYIEGRSDNMLNVGGIKVNPAMIEKVLAAHPQVCEAVVLPLSLAEGAPEKLVAAIIHNGTPPDHLPRYCAEKLGEPLPQHYIFVREFPRNQGGKVMRSRLQEQIRQALAAQQAGTATLVSVPPLA